MTASSSVSAPLRLPKGGWIDRSAPLAFTLDNRSFSGFAGDTLASALLASGQRLIGRSFKYHRPRGVLTAGSEEPNALVELRSGARREPNTKATTIELYQGLEASTQNAWPSAGFDLGRVNSLFSPVIAAGFYYKTFMWPASFWERIYEPLIRQAAGLGRAAGVPDPDHYEHVNAFCDVLVVGSGPAGLAAVLAAARSGVRVIVCEEDFVFGGRLLSDQQEVDGAPGAQWASSIIAELADSPDVRLMPRTTVFGCYDGGVYGALERVSDHLPLPAPHQPRQRFWRIMAKRTVLATGAVERPIVFGGNDRPGVMMSGAVRTYANRFAVAAGRKVLVFTNNNDGWRTARDLRSNGIDVVAVVDTRPAVSDAVAADFDGQVSLGAAIVGTKGGRSVRAALVQTAHGRRVIACDAIAIAGGWNPNIGLACHHGARPKWREDIAAFVPSVLPGGMEVAGAANGAMTLAACLKEGSLAGQSAVRSLGVKVALYGLPTAHDEDFEVRPTWYVADSVQKAFVDFQNDVTATDVMVAEREGFRSVEHLKRYTTLGMATDQGRTANVAGLAMMAALTGRSIPETGTTTHRPPYTPVAIGALAGPHRGKAFQPVRRTPSHDWAREQGAVFTEAGLWLRAQYFPVAGEDHWLATVNREVRSVRESVGVCDVSTLGKIELRGSDVGLFLDRLYINTFSTLPAARARYGIMLREDGFVLDDGTVSRLTDDCFFLTTTTANASRVFQHMQFCHQILWPELDVQFASVTDQWAQYSVAGPHARQVLREVVDPQFDISNEVFPYMAAGQITVCGGVPGRLYRISFSGELAYEIGVPARYGESFARVLMRAGAPHDVVPYGTEALSVMRIEKGHVAGNEMDGRTTAYDFGHGRMMATNKDYIGRVLADRPALKDPERMRIVGLKPSDPTKRLRAGAHLLPLNAEKTAEHDQGVVTSVAFSPSLGHWIGLGLLQQGPERVGQHVLAADLVRNADVEVEVCPPCFIDPAGERLRV
ncbi:MAG: sarcosine oxidase subunit alpha family protein [Xanthobacteraceae bacterium]